MNDHLFFIFSYISVKKIKLKIGTVLCEENKIAKLEWTAQQVTGRFKNADKNEQHPTPAAAPEKSGVLILRCSLCPLFFVY